MKNFKSLYALLSFLITISSNLMCMEMRPQQQTLQKKQAVLVKAIEKSLEIFTKKSHLSFSSKPQIMQHKGFYMQVHEGPNRALAVFKLAQLSELSPISNQEANQAHTLLKVYDIKRKDGVWSVMFDYLNKQLLPTTKEQAAFLLVAPLLKEAIRTDELVSPAFLSAEQKQILAPASLRHTGLILVQRQECKAFFDCGKLASVFKIESHQKSSEASSQAIHTLNYLLHHCRKRDGLEKTVAKTEAHLLIDKVCDFALHEGFAVGMVVHTATGTQKIETLQAGDLVRSQDLENDTQVVCPITNISKEIIPSYVEIVLNHETIITALGQKFYLEPLDKWVTAQKLIQSPELQAHFPEVILEIRQVHESIEIYKLTVAHEHNFYVTEKQLLVHNMNPDVVFKTFEVGAHFITTYVIPAAQAVGPIVGPAIGGWIFTHIIHGFRGKPKKDGERHHEYEKKEKKHTHAKKDKQHNPDKKKSKDKEKDKGFSSAGAPGGPGGPNGPNDPNWPPKKNGNNNKKPDNDDKDKKEDQKNEEKKNDNDTGEKNQEIEHPNGTYEQAPYHHQHSNGKKSPAPKNGQKALDKSIPLDKEGNTSRRLSVDGEDFVVLDKTSEGKFHGHIRTWDELKGPMRTRLIKEGFANNKGKIIL